MNTHIHVCVDMGVRVDVCVCVSVCVRLHVCVCLYQCVYTLTVVQAHLNTRDGRRLVHHHLCLRACTCVCTHA